MSNKRIRIKKAKFEKKRIIKDQAFEIANFIIKLYESSDLVEKISIKEMLYNIRMKHIEQIRSINEVIKYGKKQLKGCRIVSISENSKY